MEIDPSNPGAPSNGKQKKIVNSGGGTSNFTRRKSKIKHSKKDAAKMEKHRAAANQIANATAITHASTLVK